MRQRSGPSKSTETLSISDIFLKIFTVEMPDIVTRHTNKKAFSVYSSLNLNSDSKREWKPVTVQEIYSFMAILICSGVNNSNTDHVSDMWHSSSYPLYGKTGHIREKNQGERVVKELAVAYKGSGRNICMDYFFTSLSLAQQLLSWNL